MKYRYDEEENNIAKAYKFIYGLLYPMEKSIIRGKLSKRKDYSSHIDFKNWILETLDVDVTILDTYDINSFNRGNWNEYEVFRSDLIHHVIQIENENFAKNLNGAWLEAFKFFGKEFKLNDVDLYEMQTVFAQFCLRMMYIAEHKGEEGYQETNLEWLGNWHIEKLSNILDWMYNNRDSIVEAYTPMCLNYSFGNFEKGMLENRVAHVTGRYWKLDDANYDGMLKQFLRNLYNDNEIVDDILIWCYISNATTVFNIQEYLRTIKILLNNNRVENDKIDYNIEHNKHEKPRNTWFSKERIIWFTKYSVYGIPSYYNFISIDTTTKLNPELSKSFIAKEKNKKYLKEIILLNDAVMRLSKNNLQIGALRYIVGQESENYKQIEKIIVKEWEKQNNPEYLWNIRNLENLPYFNGLLDSVLDEDNKPISDNFKLTGNIKMRNKIDIENSCTIIYKHLSRFEVDLINFTYTGNTITTNENREAQSYRKDIETIPITLCDLFTDPTYKKYIEIYIKEEYIDANLILCPYLYCYEWLPTSWLLNCNGTLEITCYGESRSESPSYVNATRYEGIAYQTIPRIAFSEFFGDSNDAKSLETFIQNKRKDSEFRDKFIYKSMIRRYY